PAPGRRPHLRRTTAVQARSPDPAHLRPDATAQVGDLDGRLRVDRRDLRQLRDGAGDRHDRPGRRVCPGVPAPPRGAAVRGAAVAQEDQGRIAVRPRRAARGAAARRARPAVAARADRRDLRAVRKLRPPVPLGVNPSAEALRATFGSAIGRAVESCGDTIVHVDRTALLEVMAWLRDTPGQQYDYLVDVTAVEYRDRERPLELVYNLRSLERRADLRVKVEVDPRGDLTVDSIVPLWRGADRVGGGGYGLVGGAFPRPPRPRRTPMWGACAQGPPLPP